MAAGMKGGEAVDRGQNDERETIDCRHVDEIRWGGVHPRRKKGVGVPEKAEDEGEGALCFPSAAPKSGDDDLRGVGESGEDGEPEEGCEKVDWRTIDVIAEAEQAEQCADHDGGQGDDTDDFGRAVKATFFVYLLFCVCDHRLTLRRLVIDVL